MFVNLLDLPYITCGVHFFHAILISVKHRIDEIIAKIPNM